MAPIRVFIWIFAFIAINSETTALVQRTCSSQTQCLNNECCVSNNPPRGRRWLSGHDPGHCVAMGSVGGDCMVRSNSDPKPPSGLVYYCPCEANLHCVGNGMIEVPLGEHGTCM